MKNPNPLEKDIEAKVCAFARGFGYYVRKFTSPSCRSVPDRMYITQTGVVFFIEFKRLGEKSTPAQALEQEKIRKMGLKVFVIDNVADGKKVIVQMSYHDPMF